MAGLQEDEVVESNLLGQNTAVENISAEEIPKLSAGQYNVKARDEGREDWRTAYRSDVLKIDDTVVENNTPAVVNTTPNVDTDTKVNIGGNTSSETTNTFDVEAFKDRGSSLIELEDVIENKYNTVATNQNGKLVANIGGVDYEWNLDEEGNPIKTKVGGESEQDIFSRMMGGEQFTDTGIKTTKEYQVANQRKLNLDKYTGMSHEDLSYQLGETLLKGTKEYEDLKNINPELLKKAEDLKGLNAVNNMITGKKEDTKMTIEEMISKSLMEIINPSDVSDYKTMLSEDQSIIDNKAKLTAKDLEVIELEDQLENIEEDIEADLNGALISKSRKNALITERAKGLDRLYRTKIAEREVLAGALKTRAEDIKYDFELSQSKRAEELENFQLMYNLYQNQLGSTTPTKWSKLNDGTLYNETTGETKDITGASTGTEGKWSKLDDDTLYNDTTGQFKDRNTNIVTDSDGTVDYSSVDFSTNPMYANTGEAAFANNNPTGITFNAASNDLKNLWNEAGVNFKVGTARPTGEGGNYVKFDSVQDGMDAYMIALTQRGDDVDARLQAWVGTSEGPTYAANLMEQAGIEKGAKFSELSDEQLSALMSAQLQKESPKFYAALTGEAESQQAAPQYSDNVINTGQNILKGKSKISDIADDPKLRKQVQDYINNNDALWKEGDSKIQNINKSIDILDSIVDWKGEGTGFFGNDTDMESLVEDISGDRQASFYTGTLTNQKKQILNKLQFILDQEVLQKLIDVKGEGATFGALSEKELEMLQKSASPLSAAAEKKDGKITGFAMSEKDFKAELRKSLNNFKERKEKLLGRDITTQDNNTQTNEDILVDKYNNPTGTTGSTEDLTIEDLHNKY